MSFIRAKRTTTTTNVHSISNELYIRLSSAYRRFVLTCRRRATTVVEMLPFFSVSFIEAHVVHEREHHCSVYASEQRTSIEGEWEGEDALELFGV